MPRRVGQAGFTLLEALLATAVFGVILVGAVSFFATNGSLYNRGQSKAGAQQNARVAIESAAREIRMAGYDHSGVLAGLAQPTGIQVADTGGITLVADVTGDDVVDQVSYGLQGTQLVRSISSWTGGAFPAGAAGEVADGVAQLTFSYFNAADAAIATPVASGSLGAIRRITMSVTTAQTTSGTQVSFPLVVDVRLRN